MDEIRLWRDPALGGAGTELLVGRFETRRIRQHVRGEVVIAVIIGGAMHYVIGSDHGIAESGAVLVIPAGETFAAAGNWWCRIYYPDVRTLMDMASDEFTGPQVRAGDAGAVFRDPAVARRLAALHRAIESEDHPLPRQQAFAAALSLVLQRCARPAGWPRHMRPLGPAVQRALEHVRRRFADPGLSIRELAAAADLSEYHFMRSFRAALGMTAHDYVVQCRLGAARKMLAEGLPAVEVALAAGFADQSHLIRQFRAVLGVTPGAYAELCRKRLSIRPAAPGVRLPGEMAD